MAVRINHVLIDYENVQPDMLDVLDMEHFRIWVFVGANQARLGFDIVSAMQQLGMRGQYVKISGNGPNALDFHIAYYIGLLAAQDPQAYFHIVSRDTGFDPLIEHLRGRKVLAQRCVSVQEIPAVQVARARNAPERIEAVLANLKSRGQSKPRSVKTLTSTIAALFQKQLSDAEIAELITLMRAQGAITGDENRLCYVLPD